MSIQSCITKTKAYLKESGQDKQVPTGKLIEFARRIEAAGGDSLTPAEFNAKVKDLIQGQVARMTAAARLEKLLMVAQREKALKTMVDNLDLWKEQIANGKTTPLDKSAAFEVARVWQEGGSLRYGNQTNLSMEMMAKNIRASWRNFWNAEIAPIKEIAEFGKIDRDAFIEKYALDTKSELGKTNNPAALQYAKVLKAIQGKMMETAQAYNPRLEASEEYLLKQFHNRERIMADPSEAGKQAWLSQAMATYGKKSFPELSMDEKVPKFLEIYQKINDGTFNTPQDQESEISKKSQGNVSQRMARGRELIPESGEAAWDYQSKYGPETIAQGIDQTLDSRARQVALLAKAGPLPDAMRESLLDRFESKLQGEEKAQFQSMRPTLDKSWRGATGERNTPASNPGAKLTSGAMNWAYLTKTGFAILHSFTDIAHAASLLRGSDGKTVFTNGAEIAMAVSKSFLSDDFRSARMSDFELFNKAVTSNMAQDMGGPQDSPGFTGKFMQSIGVLNMINRWHQSMQAGMATVLGKRLGDVSGIKFGDLPTRWQQSLPRYGLTENAWNVARLGSETIEGRKCITPEGVRALPDDAIENYARKEGIITGEKTDSRLLEYARQDLALKLGVMLNEHATLASMEMDTRQRNFLWGDTTINEGWGQFRRLLTEFRGASQVASDTYRRAYFSGEGMKGDLAGVAQQMLMAGLLGSMGYMAGQIASGKTPEDPTTPEFIAKMIGHTGIMGIYGSVLLNALEAHGVDNRELRALTSAIGPVPDMGFTGGAIAVQKGLEMMGAQQDASLGRRATSYGINMIPGHDLIMTKAAMDYYLGHMSQYFMGDSGFLGALENGTSRNKAIGGGNQSYLFGRPTSDSFLGD